MHEKLSKVLKDIFLKCVYSVNISNIIRTKLNYDITTDVLKVCDVPHSFLNKNVYMVGAGKAVFRMAVEVEKMLSSRLKYGIVSIPAGAYEKSSFSSSVIEFYEGAKNNQPDINSENATKKIIDLVKSLNSDSTLIVLLSGGGSALLPAPVTNITLKEKSELIRNLANSGADIVELNSVRKSLSSVKGGKLAKMAYPANIICLLVSDIIGDQNDFIASGPTYEDNDGSLVAIEILRKYSMFDKLPATIKEVFCSKSNCNFHSSVDVKNYVIGNNGDAVNGGQLMALDLGYQTLILSDSIHGNIETLSDQYCKLICTVILLLSNAISKSVADETLKSLDCINLSCNIVNEIISMKLDSDKKGIFLISGGEPTVNIKGVGKGGRSQELALRFASNYHRERKSIELLNKYNVYMLCAGTDGMDGPTDAAGAIGHSDLVTEAHMKNIDVSTYLSNNDSYNFYEKFGDQNLHIKIGHTHTNVMDIHMILIEPKNVNSTYL